MVGKLLVVDLGLIGYQEAHDLQLKLVELRSKGRVPDTLLLLEHDHVITLGRRLRSMDLRLPNIPCLLYTSPSPRDRTRSRMPSSA